jgi:hypothetical protein
VVPPCSDRISRVPPYSRTCIRITCTGLSPAMAQLSRRFHLSHASHWPGPGSLATTTGVSVDVLSYGYLDVSVPRVRFLPLCIQDKIPFHDTWKPQRSLARPLRFSKYLRWVAPFGNPRIKGYSHLPVAYRSVSRPSSPVHAKASTNCP